mmetsp:Transcript_23444/g.51473  ORF Transcript_23444/g.51473 Transcript_23444/m.51473 type:complete len:314 (-) Transcript_23444:919-1860(-)
MQVVRSCRTHSMVTLYDTGMLCLMSTDARFSSSRGLPAAWVSETKGECMCRWRSRSRRHSQMPPPMTCSSSGSMPCSAATCIILRLSVSMMAASVQQFCPLMRMRCLPSRPTTLTTRNLKLPHSSICTVSSRLPTHRSLLDVNDSFQRASACCSSSACFITSCAARLLSDATSRVASKAMGPPVRWLPSSFSNMSMPKDMLPAPRVPTLFMYEPMSVEVVRLLAFNCMFQPVPPPAVRNCSASSIVSPTLAFWGSMGLVCSACHRRANLHRHAASWAASPSMSWSAPLPFGCTSLACAGAALPGAGAAAPERS